MSATHGFGCWDWVGSEAVSLWVCACPLNDSALKRFVCAGGGENVGGSFAAQAPRRRRRRRLPSAQRRMLRWHGRSRRHASWRDGGDKSWALRVTRHKELPCAVMVRDAADAADTRPARGRHGGLSRVALVLLQDAFTCGGR